jgi:hypothetical protein
MRCYGGLFRSMFQSRQCSARTQKYFGVKIRNALDIAELRLNKTSRKYKANYFMSPPENLISLLHCPRIKSVAECYKNKTREGKMNILYIREALCL